MMHSFNKNSIILINLCNILSSLFVEEVMHHPIEHFCCQNAECVDYGIRGKGNLSFRGWSGKGKRIHMVYCYSCISHFSERKGTVLEQSRLPHEKAVSLLEHISEGDGTRKTGRLVHVDKNTVTRYIRKAGEHSEDLHDELVAFSPSNPRDSA